MFSDNRHLELMESVQPVRSTWLTKMDFANHVPSGGSTVIRDFLLASPETKVRQAEVNLYAEIGTAYQIGVRMCLFVEAPCITEAVDNCLEASTGALEAAGVSPDAVALKSMQLAALWQLKNHRGSIMDNFDRKAWDTTQAAARSLYDLSSYDPVDAQILPHPRVNMEQLLQAHPLPFKLAV